MSETTGRIRGRVWRKDCPEDEADTFDEPNTGGWTPGRLIIALALKYGPTTQAEFEFNGRVYRYDGLRLVR